MEINNKASKSLKSNLRDLFAQNFAEVPRLVTLTPSGRVVHFLLTDRRRVTAMLDYRSSDQFFPTPTFGFTADFLKDAEAIGANFTIAVNESRPEEMVLVHHNGLKFIKDENGDYIGIHYAANH